MSNILIDVNASFNPMGDIKPLYVRLEDDRHELHTHRIQRINYTKKERFSGIESMLFSCSICVEDYLKEINIRYYFQSHKWALIVKG